jgi:hypothetical protein
MLTRLHTHHPGEGRGPDGGRRLADVALRYCDLSNWAPAFAGVVRRQARSATISAAISAGKRDAPSATVDTVAQRPSNPALAIAA